MVTYVAIGGGEIGRPGTKKEIIPIDKQLLALSGKQRPKVLFIPTASNDSEGYCAVVEEYFSALNAQVSHLCIIRDKPSKASMQKAVAAADVLYVGGGNTRDMMRVWKRTGFTAILKQYERTNKVYAGLSAGAVCWFEGAWSDSARMKDPKADYAIESGLGFLPGICNPHAIREPARLPGLESYLSKHDGFAYSIDDCAALVIHKGQMRVLSAGKGYGATILTSSKGTVITSKLS